MYQIFVARRRCRASNQVEGSGIMPDGSARELFSLGNIAAAVHDIETMGSYREFG